MSVEMILSAAQCLFAFAMELWLIESALDDTVFLPLSRFLSLSVSYYSSAWVAAMPTYQMNVLLHSKWCTINWTNGWAERRVETKKNAWKVLLCDGITILARTNVIVAAWELHKWKGHIFLLSLYRWTGEQEQKWDSEWKIKWEWIHCVDRVGDTMIQRRSQLVIHTYPIIIQIMRRNWNVGEFNSALIDFWLDCLRVYINSHLFGCEALRLSLKSHLQWMSVLVGPFSPTHESGHRKIR